jgi:large subunit ribosomal protein L9
VPAKAGDTGKLFGSVTNVDVATAVRASGGPLVDKRKVTLKGAVKTVGAHKATVTLHPDVVATVSFEVVAE